MATGTGYGSDMLRREGQCLSLVGCDISPEAVEYAKANYGHEKITFNVGSAEDISLDDKFDVIVSFETIEHVQNPDKMLDNFIKHCHAETVGVFSVPNLWDKNESDHHHHDFDQQSFMELLQPRFKEIEALCSK